jgi:hypothetical protein
MKKFLLYSILIATVAIPMIAASDRSPIRGFRKTVLWTVAFNALYLFGVLYVWPRLPS